MQPDHHWQAQTVARFIQASRQYLGLVQAPVAVRPPQRVAAPQRQIFRTLLVAGSLGGVLGMPAFAAESSRLPEEPTRNQSAQAPRHDERAVMTASGQVLAGRPR